MMRLLATAIMISIFGASLGGCVTMGGGASMLTVNTDPPGALIVINGFGECESPCTVKLDGPRQARIAKAGFVTTTVTLAPGRKSVTVPLELAAASDDVDTTTLPDLN